MTLQDKINHFCSYFSRQIEVINSLDIDEERLEEATPVDFQTRFYRKVLIVTALDTLAGIRFHKKNYSSPHKKNRERFIRFITEYCEWDHGPLVSSPFLLDHLVSINSQNGRLHSYLEGVLAEHDGQGVVYKSPNDFDKSIDILMPLAATEKEEEAIWYYQHFALLYRYRNFLIHETREPGTAMEGVRDGETHTYYHGYINETKWYMVYPIEVFTALLANAINNLKHYFEEQEVDPYSFVGDTSRW